MTTTYETERYKAGTMEIRGVKRSWVYDKKTGHFAKLRGKSPIWSQDNTERHLVDALGNNGAIVEVVIKLNYTKKGKSHYIMCEAHIVGKYQLKDNEFMTIKHIIENHINQDKTLMDLSDHAFNNYFRLEGMPDIPFNNMDISINQHGYIDYLPKETFNTTLLMRGRSINVSDKEELSHRLSEIIKGVIR